MDRGDLDKCLANMTPLSFPFAQKLSVAHDVTEVLVYIHSMNVIHRDLKASNVLLNAAMRAKLTDFGISREFDCDDTMTAGMAPEVATTTHPSTRTRLGCPRSKHSQATRQTRVVDATR
ncbi:Aste57867_24896 [Aphanomyces stellatus]|uniref:Aste57867_24896 protein n=1 Tax=Aphanomyces stellatus TaxID=120398 RepID=A0A485LTS3_9STRA|nr:hypothetical protein As57867_024818 [Aphanomyces stellatus]VFU01530.1 Aste57867_24896 [Aphanomyces stellatus]